MPDDFVKNHNGININYPTSDHEENARKINSYIATLDKAKNKIKQKIIASDNSNEKIATYTAITQFKKTNE